ncbi:MAG: hypothetical protein H6622_10935 [Halobacteriovoraceae bacterium]|nr:hypothetical protein [Halobacteriovoraceae bacterium]
MSNEKIENKEDNNLMALGLYAHSKNEKLEGALLEVRSIFDEFYETGAWGEMTVSFKNGSVVLLEKKVTSRLF